MRSDSSTSGDFFNLTEFKSLVERLDLEDADLVMYLLLLSKNGLLKVEEDNIVVDFPPNAHEDLRNVTDTLKAVHECESDGLVQLNGIIGNSEEWVDLARFMFENMPMNEGAMYLASEWLCDRVFSECPFRGYRIFPSSLFSVIDFALDIKDGNSFYEPWSSVFSPMLWLNPGVRYIGNAPDNYQLAIGKMLMMLNDRPTDCLYAGNPFTEDFTAQPDYIFIDSTSLTCDTGMSVIEMLLKAINYARIKVAFVCHRRLCFNKVLNQLVAEGYIESICSVYDQPGHLMPLVIIAGHANRGSECIEMIKLPKNFNSALESEDFTKAEGFMYENIPTDVILENNGILYPDYYLHDNSRQNSELVPIGNLIHEIQPTPAYIDEGRILNSDVLRQFFGREVISAADVSVSTTSLMGTGELTKLYHCDKDFLAVRSTDGYASYCKSPEAIYFPQNFWAFEVDTDKVRPEYLVSVMRKESFLDQIQAHGGFGNPLIDAKDIMLKCRVPLPSDLSEQTRLAMESRGDYVGRYINELETKLKTRLVDFEQSQRQRKHSLKNAMDPIVASVKTLLLLINEQPTLSKDFVICGKTADTLGQLAERLNNNIINISRAIGKLVPKEEYQAAESVNIGRYIQQYKSNSLARDYEIQIDESVMSLGEATFVFIAPDHLAEIFDNLCNNAKVHGFVDNSREDYAVRFSLSINDNPLNPMAFVCVSNNGVPVSQCIDPSHVFAWGISDGKGSGIGCNHLQAIARHFGGDAEYRENKWARDGFASQFIISLPITDKYEN